MNIFKRLWYEVEHKALIESENLAVFDAYGVETWK